MNNNQFDHLPLDRPSTSFSVHFRVREKQRQVTPSPAHYRVFHHLTIQQFSESDEFIQIRPLTATALSASEQMSPLRKRLQRIKNSPVKNVNPQLLSCRKPRVRKIKDANESIKAEVQIEEICINAPQISITNNKSGLSKSLDTAWTFGVKVRGSTAEKRTNALKNQELKLSFRGKLKKGSCMNFDKPPAAKLINNLKFAF